MRKVFIFWLFCLFTICISGKEIFIFKPGDTEGKSCQAVQIKYGWYLTAAHCVADICNSKCKVQMQIHGDIAETYQKHVYWLNEKRGNKSSYDIALINFKDLKTEDFLKDLQILIIDNSVKLSEPKIINRSLEIPFNFGENEGKVLSRHEVFYGPKSKTIFTKDLGLFHGLSGAGVFTNKGELIAITSATAGKGTEARFSVFSVFDERVESFLKQKIPTLYFKHISPSDFKESSNLFEDKEILISLDNNK